MNDLAQKAVMRQALPAEQDDPTGYYDPVEGCVMADPMFESAEVKARLVPLYPRAPQPAKQPLTDEHELILIDGVEYAVQPQVAAEILRLHMANKTKRQRLSGLGKAAIGRKHFGNPIPQEWYAAANDLEAAHGITGETK